MNASRVSWIFLAAVAGAWFASAAGVSRPALRPQPPAPSAEAVALDHLVADVQTQASRLRKRLQAAPAPTAPFRNPFTFAERPRPIARASKPTPAPAFVPPPAPVAPAEPPLQLIGIAEKKVGDGVVRTAMLAPGDADALIMANVGQKILGTYEVVAVSVDAVELKDLVTGEARRLVLKHP